MNLHDRLSFLRVEKVSFKISYIESYERLFLMLASIVKTSLVIKYITVTLVRPVGFCMCIEVCVCRGTGSWRTSVTYTLVYSVRHFDGHRFITFIYRERNI